MDPDLPDPQPLAPVTLPERGTGERARRRQAAQAAAATPAAGGVDEATTAREEAPQTDREEPPPSEEALDPPPTPPTSPGRPRPSTRRRVAFALSLVVLVAAVPVLIYVGYSKVLHTTSGRKVDPVDDPSEPGYEANVAPTPVELVAEVGPDGRLVGAVVLSLTTSGGGGSLLFLPAGTVVPAVAGGGTLASAYAQGALDGFRRAAAVMLRTGFDGVAAIDAGRWSELVAPVAPLSVTNPDRLPAAGGAPAFAPGALELAPDQVGAYVAARRSGESDLNRLARQQLVWEAWLGKVGAAGGAPAVAGETATGLGRFVAALSAGARQTATLPVDAVTDGSVVDGFAPQAAAVPPLLGRLIPYPTSDQPGDRIRVRILDGTGVAGLREAAARLLVPAGAEVAIVGNADRFDHQVTQLLGVGDPGAAAAAVLQRALGVGTVAPNEVLDDVVEVTVVLGADFADAAGLTTTTTAGGGGAGG